MPDATNSAEFIEFTSNEYGIIVGKHNTKSCCFKDINDYPHDVVIPSQYQNKSVVEIGCYSFSKTNITSIFIPNTIMYIGEYAFFCCDKLEKVTFQKNSALSIIAKCAFAFISELKMLDIPSSVSIIDSEKDRRQFVGGKSLTCISYHGSYSFASEYLIQDYNRNLKIHVNKYYAGTFGVFNDTLFKDGKFCDA